MIVKLFQGYYCHLITNFKNKIKYFFRKRDKKNETRVRFIKPSSYIRK